MAFHSSLLLYTLQVLKDDKHETSSDVDKQSVILPTSIQSLPSEATSIPSFAQNAQQLPCRSRPLIVTKIEWRAEPFKRLYQEYIVIHVSGSVHSTAGTTIRIDRHGNLGIKVPWWHLRPIYFFSNTKRASTTVLARPTGDAITNPSIGTSILEYTHWTHAIPDSASLPDLKRGLERARINACTALNHAIRPYILHSSHMSDKQIRQGRRWVDSRGLQFVHTDIARALASAMDTSMVSCFMQVLWVTVLPSRLVRQNLRNNVCVRKEYLRVVDQYHKDLRVLADTLSNFGSEARERIALSWGINESGKLPGTLIRVLSGSLSSHAFISPHVPVATLPDVASRLDTMFPSLPAFGPAHDLCSLHSEVLAARLPDKLWHAYAVSRPLTPVSASRAIRRRLRNSGLFWLLVDMLVQWFIALLLLPQDGPHGLWLTCTVLYHVCLLCLQTLRVDRVWRKIWRVYEADLVQDQESVWQESGTLSSMWSQSKASLWNTKWDSRYMEIPMVILN